MDNENSNLRESPITRDTLLIADADTKEKRRVPKLLLECSMRQLDNEIIASPDDGGLVGARNAITNDVIISDTTFVMACLDPTKPPASGEATSSLCNYRMEHPNKSFGNRCFTLVSASAISKVSRVIGD